MCQLLTYLKRVRTSLPFGGNLITDAYKKKLVHMLILPFPVCAYATIYYKRRRIVLVVFLFCNKLQRTHKKEMELLAFCYICQLLTIIKRVRKSLPFGGHLITDTYIRKLIHMLIIPFPVCAYAAIYYIKKISFSRLPFL